MIYRNNTEAAILACERARTGNYGLDEDFYSGKEERDNVHVPDFIERTDNEE